MADGPRSRRKHTKRRYLTDQNNPTIPKQSRRRWYEANEADLNHEIDNPAPNSAAADEESVGDTTTTLSGHDDIDSDIEVTETIDQMTAVNDDHMNTVCSYDEYYFSQEGENNNPNSADDYQNETEHDGTSTQEDTNIIGGDETIRDGSDITRGQATVTVLSFILRHHLTGVGVEHLLEMFEIFAPGCLPSSNYLLTKGITSRSHEFDAHLFCPVCDAYLDRYSDSENLENCNSCETELNRDKCLKDGNFYLYISIENQLRQLLKRHSLIKKSDFVYQEDIHGVFSGRVIKGHFLRGELSDDDITLIWNCDGAPVFKSSKRSIWPLQACINEISPTSTDNCLLIGLWFSKAKPWSHCYLKPFIKELKFLGSEGMTWTDVNNVIVHSRVFSLCASCDSCARPMFRNTMQFNGQFGCDWCLLEGEVIERGNGHSRIYKPPDTVLEMRDNVRFMEDALASSDTDPVNGIRGISPLLFLPLFDIVKGFVPDYLHCILLGIVRSFTGLWFDSSNHQQPWYIGNSASDISNRLISMKLPSNISRLPRSLSERKFWKGSEWKSFLLYYSLIILDGKLPQQYLNHWFLLVFATSTLLQDKITTAEIDLAESSLRTFVRNVPFLYGQEFCTFNVHQLLHISDAVRDWGPLWVFSCFRFESNIGNVLSLVRGTKCVPMQICKTFLLHTLLPTLHSKYFTVCDMRLESLFNRMACSGRYVRKKSVQSDGVNLYGSALARMLTTAERVAFDRLYGCTPKACTYTVYNRFSFNSIYMCSVDYKQSNRHSDDTVQVTSGKFCVILKCIVGKFFCFHDNDCECEDKALIFVNEIDQVSDRPLFSNRELHISSNSFLFCGRRNYETVCAEPTQVFRKCFRYQKNREILICPVPTTKELDK